MRRLLPFETASLLDSSFSSGSRPILLLGLFKQRVQFRWRQCDDFRVVSKGQNVPAPGSLKLARDGGCIGERLKLSPEVLSGAALARSPYGWKTATQA